ncbi:MAG: BON domain-containing protein [Wenzhouxiangella sp.]
MQHRLKVIATLILLSLMIGLAGCAGSAKRASTGEYIDDTVISTKVRAAIFNDENLRTSEISVETFKGVVQLSGFVSSQEAINGAIQHARSVQGVESVVNSMRLR